MDEQRESLIETDQSRAREAAMEAARELGLHPNKSRRVRFCRRLMEDGIWVRGETAPALAAIWGFAKATVEHDSAEASHQLENPAELAAGSARVATRSIDWADEAHEKGQLEAAGKLLELHGKVTGAIAPATMNVLVDARTGALKPEIAGAMQQAQDELLAACRRAAVALGVAGEAFDAALAAEMDSGAPALLAGGGDG